MMTFNDLPLLLRPIEVERLSGLKSRDLARLGEDGVLEIVRINPAGYRYYTKESVRIFLKIEGNTEIKKQ